MMGSEPPLESYEAKQANAYFEAIGSFASRMVPTFSYLAVWHEGKWQIYRARLTFSLPGRVTPKTVIHTANMLGGVEHLPSEIETARRLVDDMLDGLITIGGERLHFAPQFGGGYPITYIPIHPDGSAGQRRISVLEIHGCDMPNYAAYPPFDWELRASSEPFDGVWELFNALNLQSNPHSRSQFDIVALEVVAIDPSSMVVGTEAQFRLRLASGLERSKAAVGYRVQSDNRIVARGQVDSSKMEWSSDGHTDIGTCMIDVPAAAVVQAFACYADVAYQYWWFGDPSHSQNPRRAAFETADPNLDFVQSVLTAQSKNARDLEYGVAWLLWMLGFSSAHLGTNNKMQDNADVFVAVPAGHFAVIECTSGMLKSDNKLPKLRERANAVRNRLASSNNSALRVLPVIWTTKTREEVRGELDDARQMGVCVVTRDDIPQLINRTLLPPDADAIFHDAEQTLKSPTTADSDSAQLSLLDGRG